MLRALGSVLIALSVTGCTTVGTLGIVTKPGADQASLLKSGVPFTELGPVSGNACRNFLLAIIPWGDAAFSTAVDDALAQVGGDAMINVTVTNSLYGYIPIYNVFSYTCTRVSGTAVKFDRR